MEKVNSIYELFYYTASFLYQWTAWMLPSGQQYKIDMNIQGPNQKNSGNQIKESNKTQCISIFKFTPQKEVLETSKTAQVKHWTKTFKCANHNPEKAEAITKYIYVGIYIYTHTLVLAQKMSSDFLTVSE